ncbi:methyl-accepting chemotaxis protein [Colwellia asteriadis]|uniref:Methyl-accepting chemotaxis protein n=1 Tax=Colwellia asteriadis TaxID=517723 RepID=A0ABN1L517_9GAMM
MKLTISQRLYAGFAIVILLMLTISTVIWLKSQKIQQIVDEVQSDDIPGVILYLQVLDEVGDMQSSMLEYLTGEVNEVKVFNESYAEFNTQFEKLKLIESAKATDREKMAKIKNLVDTFAAQAKEEVFSRYNPETERWAFTLIKELEKTSVRELESLLDISKKEALKNDLSSAVLYLELIDEAGDLIASLTGFIAGDINKKSAFDEDKKSLAEYLSQLQKLEQSPQNQANLVKIGQLSQKIIAAGEEAFAKFDPTARASALKAADKMERELFNVVEDILDKSSDEEKVDASKGIDETLTSINDQLFTLVVISIIAIIAAIAISHYLATNINKRLNNVLNVANKVSEGDLTADPIVDDSGDEIGAIAIAMNTMSKSLNDLIKDINNVSNSVASSSNDILGATIEMTNSCNEQAHKASIISVAVEEMTATVNEVASQSSAAATSASESGVQATTGGNVVKQTVQGINLLSEAVNSTAEMVNKLGARSTEIGDVIQVINGIAEQTNLLALNAAIEAARAGEQGRGFAVVADEVRTLAARTTQATQEVAKSIGAIQSDTTAVIASIDQGIDQASKSVELANKAGDSLDIIMAGTQSIEAMITSIAAACEEQSATTIEISRDVVAISGSSSEILDVTNQTSEKASRMNELSDQMKNLVNRFKLRA